MNKKITDSLEIRKLAPDDDLNEVADLIYYSDNYIYPYLFDNDISVAEKVLVNMISGDTIYNYNNIHVALCEGQIVAMIVSKKVPVKADYETMIDCFIKAGVPVGSRFAKTFNEYFKLLEDEQKDVYIANLAVDKMYRGMGVGKMLMKHILGDTLTYHLEVVKANSPAVALYKKLGFKIDCEYPGFTGIACYRMTRRARRGSTK